MSTFKTLLATAAAAAALMVGSAAQATVVAFENFESYAVTDHGGGDFHDLNFTGFTNGWTVSEGAVDLIGTPNQFGLGGDTSDQFIDLDGSIGDGGVMRTASWNFQAGDLVTLDFDLAGNQRGNIGFGPDQFDFGFQTTGGAILFNNITWSGPLNLLPGNTANGCCVGVGQSALLTDDTWRHYSISFRAGNAGSLTAYVATTSADNVGPLVDNLRLDIGAVPEPTTWAIMLLGFGGMGAMLRRRRALALA